MHIIYNLLHIAKSPRRKVVPINTPAVRDGPSCHPWWVFKFLLISVNLIGENAILFYICISLIASDVEHLFHMFESFAFFLLGIVWMDSQVPLMRKLLNRKQHRKPEVQFCCHRASAHVFWSASIEQASLIPSHHAYFDYFLCSHLSAQPMSPSSLGLPPSILLHQAVVIPEPEIVKREGQMWSKLVLSGKTLLWKKSLKRPPYEGPSLPTGMFPKQRGGGHILF